MANSGYYKDAFASQSGMNRMTMIFVIVDATATLLTIITVIFIIKIGRKEETIQILNE